MPYPIECHMSEHAISYKHFLTGSSMAYTLESSPPPMIKSTTEEVIVTLTAWEKAKAWLTDMDNISYMLIASLAGLYGACVIIYIIHKLRKMYRKAQRRHRKQMLAEKLDKQPMLGDDLSLSSVGDSPEVSRLTYHGGTTPLDKQALYPATNKATMYPPRPKLATKGPIKKMTTIMAKPKTQIVMRCRCEGRMHTPGCPHFKVPDIKTPTTPLTASSSDVSLTMRDAMEKVDLYAHEIKTNPSMRALLEKYRQLKQQRTQKTWSENAEKGNWQGVPIAQLLERKKEMKERNQSRMS
ncbi:hypothetical protein EB796_015040 [Bugula neritina]|uniref:Uncharacterized protein n=1 Tax=Bugula neritina TaxID=10212 RepID=A0A7J7JKJ9_BUGNE|nr:hypothetical protein EB796_015040 [Bugula neritina]